MSLPSAGSYALVYTDMDSSTATNQLLGDLRARELMRRHDGIVRGLVARHQGMELTHLGDGFKLAFGSARHAIDFAIGLQRTLAVERASGTDVSVRVGVHVGEAVLEDGDLFGSNVIVAQRIMSRAHAAQVLISEAAAKQLCDAQVPLLDRGIFLLKGMRQGMRLFEVAWSRGTGLPSVHDPAVAPPRRMRERPPLVGRQDELARLEARLEDAEEGKSSFVVIAGDPGIGKTRLCAEFLTAMSARALGLAVGRCHEVGAEPYAPIFDLLSQLAAGGGRRAPRSLAPALAPLARWMPPLAGALGLRAARQGPARVADEREVGRFRAALAGLLTSWSREQPLVLLLDDIQWLDPASLEVVRSIGRRMVRAPGAEETRILVVATLRESEEGGPTSTLLGELHRDRVLERMPLGPLESQSVRALVGDLLHGRATEAELSRIGERSQGNPYFVEELCRDLAERRDLAGRREVERAERSSSVPEQLKRVLEARLARTSDGCLSALRVAALLETRFRYDLWRAATGLSDEAMWACVEEATAARLLRPVTEERPLRYGFEHLLVAEVLRETTSLPRRQALHLSIADALEALDPQASIEIARHLVAAGEAASDERLADWCERGGRAAAALHAPREAARLLEEALAALDRLGRSDAPETDAVGSLLCDVQGQLGELSEAAALAERVCATLDQRGDFESADRVRARLARAYTQHALPKEALRVLAPVVERPGPPIPTRGAALAEFAVALDLTGDGKGLRETARALARLARNRGDRELRQRSLGLLRNWYANHSTNLPRALALSRDLLAEARERRDPWTIASAAADVALFELVTGRVGASLASLELGLSAALKVDAAASVLNIRAVRALAFCFRGEWDLLAGEWSLAKPLLGRVPGALRTGLLLWACVRRDLWLGRPGPPLPSAEKLYGGIAQFQRDVLAGAGLVAAERRAPQAQAILRRAAEFQGPDGVGVNWLTAAQSIAAGWAELGCASEAAPWAAALTPYRGTLLVDATDLVLGRIARLQGSRPEAERALARALRLARRESLGPLLVSVRREQERLWETGGGEGDARRAEAARRERLEVAESLGMASEG